jgi:hypothetical protein
MTEKEKAVLQKQEYKKKLAEIKSASGCVDCGIKNHIVLDFDHLRDKKYNVSQMVRDGFPWKVIKKEIEKCEVVCANCHRIRNHLRLSS